MRTGSEKKTTVYLFEEQCGAPAGAAIVDKRESDWVPASGCSVYRNLILRMDKEVSKLVDLFRQILALFSRHTMFHFWDRLITIPSVLIEGNNFVKLRDLCHALGLQVSYIKGVPVVE